jgi:hypothetical protein
MASPGLLVGVSDAGEDCLINAHLDLLPDALSSGNVLFGATALADGGGRIRVWSSPTKTTGTLVCDSGTTGWQKDWPLSSFFLMGNVPENFYIEGVTGSEMYAPITLTLRYDAPDGTIVASDQIKATVARAFAGQQLSGWIIPSGHIGGVATAIENSLRYATDSNGDMSKTEAIAAASGRSVWYSLTHGAVDNNGVFKALDLDGGVYLFPVDLPADLDYSLVFVNGCCSAQYGSGSNAEAFKAAFNADAYIGWKTSVSGTLAANFALEFFSQLDGTRTINEAINATLATYEPSSSVYSTIANSIRVIGDATLVVDLSTP